MGRITAAGGAGQNGSDFRITADVDEVLLFSPLVVNELDEWKWDRALLGPDRRAKVILFDICEYLRRTLDIQAEGLPTTRAGIRVLANVEVAGRHEYEPGFVIHARCCTASADDTQSAKSNATPGTVTVTFVEE